MYYSQQSFLVLGLSKSGQAAAEFLLERQARVYVYDDVSGDRIEQAFLQLTSKGGIRLTKSDLEKASEVCDVLVLSPGVPIDHPLAVSFKRNKKAVVGESELAVRQMRCPIIAVTGTNGKTTVVSMLESVLKRGGIFAKACGNIGEPLIRFHDMGENEIAVAEISSFQMETLNSLRPHIAVILNITEDHLNRHYSMENYIYLKEKLLKNSTETEYAVLNYDDKVVRSFAERTRAKVVYFSLRERVRGAYYENGNLYFGQEKILSVTELPIGGMHNVQNALAVIAAAKLIGVSSSTLATALKSFQGVKHRLEKIGEKNGVLFIDDSKGTNVDATIKAVLSMKRETVLLLGGKHKGYQYRQLFSVLPKTKVVHAVLYGENRYVLLKNAKESGYEKVTLCDKFAFAVQVAALKAQPGQAVLLSPASASFDEFINYEERGDKFVEIVRSMEENVDRQNADEIYVFGENEGKIDVNNEDDTVFLLPSGNVDPIIRNEEGAE